MRAAPLLIAATLLVPLAAASTFLVEARDNAWSPPSLAVVVGDSVTFDYAQGASRVHNFVSTSGLGSCALPCTKTFLAAGPSGYFCGFHQSAMVGEVRVLAAHGADLIVGVNGGASTNPTSATFTAQVTNFGDAAAPASVLRAEYVGADGERHLIRDVPVGALQPAQRTTVAIAWNDGHVRTGTFQVVVTVDATGLVPEGTESNNAGSANLVFVSGLLPKQEV